MADRKQYTCNLKGTAQLALDDWTFAQSQYPSGHNGDDMLYTGRCQAYAAVLRHLTGQADPTKWQSSIDAMTPITVRRAPR